MKRLIGVGVGPGDPELVTVKAVGLLRRADVVLVPVLEGAQQGTGAADPPVQGRAEATVLRYVDPERVRRVAFALDDRGGPTRRRTAAWEHAGEIVRECLAGGASDVAFATIGDPNVYSTFTYLARTARELMPDLRVETTPGIIAMQDLAARSGTVLVEGTETLTLVPLTGEVDQFREALDSGDTVVAYKCGGRFPQVVEALRETGRVEGAAYGAMLGLSAEDVRPVRDLDPDKPIAYLSTVISPADRPERGGKLR